MKKLYVVAVMTAAMSTALCGGCVYASDVTAQSLIDEYIESSKDMSAMSAEMTLGMDMAISIPAAEQDMSVSMNADFDLEMKEPVAHVSGAMSMEQTASDEEPSSDFQNFEVYAVADKDAGKVTTYSKDGDSWYKSESNYDTSAIEQISTGMAGLLSQDLVLDETPVDLDGVICYKLTGTLDAGAFSESFASILGQSSSEDILSGFPVDMGDVKFDAEWFFEQDSHQLRKLRIDGADTLVDLLKTTLSQQMEGTGVTVDMDIDVPNFFVDIYNINYDVADIVVPDDVLSSAEDAPVVVDDDTDTDSDIEWKDEEKEYDGQLATSFEWKPEYETLTVNDIDITLRKTTVQNLVDAGFILDDDFTGDYMVNAGTTDTVTMLFNEGDYETCLYLGVKNVGESAVSVKDSVVYSIDVSTYDEPVSMKAAGIEFGATAEDIVSVLGDPTDYYGSDMYESYTYSSDNYESLEFSFDPSRNVMTGMRVYVFE